MVKSFMRKGYKRYVHLRSSNKCSIIVFNLKASPLLVVCHMFLLVSAIS